MKIGIGSLGLAALALSCGGGGGSVSTLAGNGRGGALDGTGGPTGTAEFSMPWAIAADAAGNA